ncbi:MAG: Fur family transcriptional regulator, ferric uptake regulator [Frankiales bacterium]|jgi:Fur family ferric uptake transcriptional regulator|nr:Fur family transcriptional regulator, ferric uptake regulator [Frankiales bacterium]
MPRARGAAAHRLSRREQLVLAALSGRARPVTAQELYAELRGTRDAVGLSTAYRIVHALTDRGLLHVFALEGGETGYRACGGRSHEHLVCKECGDVQEVDGATMRAAVAMLPTEGFQVLAHRLELVGRCRTCQ